MEQGEVGVGVHVYEGRGESPVAVFAVDDADACSAGLDELVVGVG